MLTFNWIVVNKRQCHLFVQFESGSMLHHRSVGVSSKKKNLIQNLTLTLTFLYLILFFIIKFVSLSWSLRLYHCYGLFTAYFLYEEVMSVTQLLSLSKKKHFKLAWYKKISWIAFKTNWHDFYMVTLYSMIVQIHYISLPVLFRICVEFV